MYFLRDESEAVGPSEVFAKHQNVLQDHFVLELHIIGLNQTSAVASSDGPGPASTWSIPSLCLKNHLGLCNGVCSLNRVCWT